MKRLRVPPLGERKSDMTTLKVSLDRSIEKSLEHRNNVWSDSGGLLHGRVRVPLRDDGDLGHLPPRPGRLAHHFPSLPWTDAHRLVHLLHGPQRPGSSPCLALHVRQKKYMEQSNSFMAHLGV